MNLLLTIALGLLSPVVSQQTSQGLSIYQVDQPIPDFSDKTKECYYCFDLEKGKLADQPLLTKEDIASFDWSSQQITLTDSGKEKVASLEIPLPGMAVAFVLDGEPVYGFWFWNSLSSFTCDRVCATPTKDFKITFGRPGVEPFGDDPRFDAKLKSYVSQNFGN